MNKTLKRELEVAFSKKTQPSWFRIVKYMVLIGLVYFFWNSRWFWLIIPGLFVLGILLHCWYRYKTRVWTKSYGGWKADNNKPVQNTKGL